jgi:hypothetical protein
MCCEQMQHQSGASRVDLIDYRVGAQQERFRDREADRLCSLEVDD